MLTFLKLGGSLITDKNRPRTPDRDVLSGTSHEIAQALNQTTELSLLLGHGSGSYGHSVASKYNTRNGVSTPEQWMGFTEVAHAAAELNAIVIRQLLDAGLKALRFPPSVLLSSENKQVHSFHICGMKTAFEHGLLPVTHGDVVFDHTLGGTIASTEEVFTSLAPMLHPQRILLAGSYAGVMDQHGNVIRRLTPGNIDSYRPAITGSESTDVTGGMFSKVTSMMDLCKNLPGLEVIIFDGRVKGSILTALTNPAALTGTVITGTTHD